MLSANAGIRRAHAFGSGWVWWPLGSKPVLYWKVCGPGHRVQGAGCRVLYWKVRVCVRVRVRARVRVRVEGER